MAHRGPTPRHIGNPRLRAARLARRWTEEDVAAALVQLSAELNEPVPGITANHVSKWERGGRSPSPFYRPRVCLVFDATPEGLGFDSTPTLNRAMGELARRPSGNDRPPTAAAARQPVSPRRLIDQVCALLHDLIALAQATGDRRGLELARRLRQRNLGRAAPPIRSGNWTNCSDLSMR